MLNFKWEEVLISSLFYSLVSYSRHGKWPVPEGFEPLCDKIDFRIVSKAAIEGIENYELKIGGCVSFLLFFMSLFNPR
jgi:hypothetical protein